MKKLIGTFYFFNQVMKRQTMIFWLVLSGIFAISLFITYFFLQDRPMFLSITGGVYVFYGIMASKVVKETLYGLLRVGVSRIQYIFLVGMYFVINSLVVAFILSIYQWAMRNVIEGLGLTKFILLHPSTLFSVGDSAFMNFAIDFILLLFCMIFGLFLSLVFHRLGLVGGYSFVGILMLSMILLIVTERYKELVATIFNSEGLYLYSESLMLCLGIYAINVLFIKRISCEVVN